MRWAIRWSLPLNAGRSLRGSADRNAALGGAFFFDRLGLARFSLEEAGCAPPLRWASDRGVVFMFCLPLSVVLQLLLERRAARLPFRIARTGAARKNAHAPHPAALLRARGKRAKRLRHRFDFATDHPLVRWAYDRFGSRRDHLAASPASPVTHVGWISLSTLPSFTSPPFSPNSMRTAGLKPSRGLRNLVS
jgi:hypothetical protein